MECDKKDDFILKHVSCHAHEHCGVCSMIVLGWIDVRLHVLSKQEALKR